MGEVTAEMLSAYHDRELGLEETSRLRRAVAADAEARAVLDAFERIHMPQQYVVVTSPARVLESGDVTRLLDDQHLSSGKRRTPMLWRRSPSSTLHGITTPNA